MDVLTKDARIEVKYILDVIAQVSADVAGVEYLSYPGQTYESCERCGMPITATYNKWQYCWDCRWYQVARLLLCYQRLHSDDSALCDLITEIIGDITHAYGGSNVPKPCKACSSTGTTYDGLYCISCRTELIIAWLTDLKKQVANFIWKD